MIMNFSVNTKLSQHETVYETVEKINMKKRWEVKQANPNPFIYLIERKQRLLTYTKPTKALNHLKSSLNENKLQEGNNNTNANPAQDTPSYNLCITSFKKLLKNLIPY